MNLLVAIAFTLIAKILYMTVPGFLSGSVGIILWEIIKSVIWINLVLMIFNLIPCPPLDGFSVVTELFNIRHTELYWTIYRYGNWILIALIIFGITGMIITPCVNFMYSLLWSFII